MSTRSIFPADRPRFWMPPEHISAARVMWELSRRVPRLGTKAIRAGARSPSVLQWFKGWDQSVTAPDLGRRLADEPVIMIWDRTIKCGDGWDTEYLLFTYSDVVYPILPVPGAHAGSGRGPLVRPVDEKALRAHERQHPGFGQSLAQELDCFLWRVQNP